MVMRSKSGDGWDIHGLKALINTMKLSFSKAEPIGTLIYDGEHVPFRALACLLDQKSVQQ